MSLTDSQKIDAMYQKIVGPNAPTPTGTATPPAKTAAVPGPGVQPPPAKTGFWNPTDADKAQFCADNGLDPRQIEPWTQSPDGETHKATEGTSLTSFPLLAATNDPVVALRYAAFGYGPDGVQMLSTATGFKKAREMADRVAASDKPGEFLPGSEYDTNESAGYALMTGFGKLDSTSPSLGGGTTVPAIMKTLYGRSNRKPGDPGASGL